MAGNDEIPVLVVAGPTCSGKSALSVAAAERFRGGIINADSMQVYRELEILTARPSAEVMRQVPHRLYGVIPAAETCSAGRWRALALEEIAKLRAQERLPIFCGGSGLYLKALTEGIASIPPIPAATRKAVRARYREVRPAALHRALAERDPLSAARLPESDRQRILRALEVMEATGRSLVEWQRAMPAGPPAHIRFHTLLLMPPRRELYRTCDMRFEQMMQAGALEEVKRLGELGLDPALPAMRALGVPELLAFCRGELELCAAVEQAKAATRQYAKRQMTWFRNQIVAELTIDEQFSERIMRDIFSFVCKKVLTRRA